jgi:Ca-activated chloride channel family protein
MIGFRHPLALSLAAVPALIFLWRRSRHLRGDAAVSVPAAQAIPASWRSRLALIPGAAAAAALVATAIALAGPRRFEPRMVAGRAGVGIAVVLDVSGSMAAEDFQPTNRLEVARSVLAGFIRGRPADSIALLAFAARAETVCPATDDQASLEALLAGVDGSRLPDGTAIGNAIATAVTRLKDLPEKSKVIVLLTDGGNNAGQIDPLTAADLAHGFGIRVHTIGVGRGGRVPITVTVRDPETGQTTRRRIEAEVPVDEDLLRKIAERTGGRFFRATDSDTLREIFGEIDSLEKSALPPRFELIARDLSERLRQAAGLLWLANLLLAIGPLRIETDAA